MCGGYSLRKSRESWTREFGFTAPGQDEVFVPRVMIRPGETIPLVRDRGRGPEVDDLLWGRSSSRMPRPIINARAESIFEKPTFKRAILERRCLIPVDGWYEWVPEVDGPLTAQQARDLGLTRAGKRRKYYQFSGGETFFFAGIYGNGQVKRDGQWVPAEAAIIITAEACPQIYNSGHHRQPVIIRGSDHLAWLDPAMNEQGLLRHYLDSRVYEDLIISSQ